MVETVVHKSIFRQQLRVQIHELMAVFSIFQQRRHPEETPLAVVKPQISDAQAGASWHEVDDAMIGLYAYSTSWIKLARRQ